VQPSQHHGLDLPAVCFLDILFPGDELLTIVGILVTADYTHTPGLEFPHQLGADADFTVPAIETVGVPLSERF